MKLKKETGIRLTILFLTVVGISFLYPSHINFKYEYNEGQIWFYDELAAPFDFPILKSEAQLDEEKNKLKKDIIPYFSWNETVETNQIRIYDSLFQLLHTENKNLKHFNDNPTQYRVFGGKLLRDIYNRGIFESSTLYGADVTGPELINLVKNGEISLLALNNFYTLDQAKIYAERTISDSKLEDVNLLLSVVTKLIKPNILPDEELTGKILNQRYQSISLTRGMVRQGDVIIPKGGLITSEVYQKLNSFKYYFQKELSSDKSSGGMFLGYFFFTLLVVGTLFYYIRTYQKNYYESHKNLIFICFWIVSYSFLTGYVETMGDVSSYIIPFAIIPIVIRNFFNFYTSLIVFISTLLVASLITSMGYEFTILHLMAGFVALISSNETRYWSNFFLSILAVLGTYLIGYLAICLSQDGYISEFELRQMGWFVGNTILSLLAYPLIPLAERVFNYTSNITLAELADLNRPLLKELSVTAPGTFQHSLQVANLAEAAAAKVDANPLLVKVAALYHDIGKIKHPQYFIENQSGVNPHNELSPSKSAKIIIDHIEDGVALAKQYRLPGVLINFIKTHHGTTKTEYFYRKAVEKYGAENLNELDYRYPGPKPRTKEETILMMADSIEAASKSLSVYTDETIDQLVDKIVSFKIDERQMDLSELSFSEIRICTSVFKKMLRSIYHVRIKYPDEVKNR